MHEGLAKKGCTKRCDKVVERLGRLKERYKRVSGQYEIRVEKAAAATGLPDPAGAESAPGNAPGAADGSGTVTAGKGQGARTKKPGKQPVPAAAMLWARTAVTTAGRRSAASWTAGSA